MIVREVAAEAIGTALLLVSVVGSGIMAERLSGGNVGLALLANAIATGGALFALIVTFAPVSGAHFNPVVTLALAWRGLAMPSRVLPFLLAQVAGAIAGVWLAAPDVRPADPAGLDEGPGPASVTGRPKRRRPSASSC